jgi:hypothetical protein
MAARRPCVIYASSASGVSHGDNIWLAGEDTAESLGGAITRVLRDPQLRRRIAEGGYQFVRERHDRRAVAAQLCQAYCRLLMPTRRWKEISARPAPLHLLEVPAANLWDVAPRGAREERLHAIA